MAELLEPEICVIGRGPGALAAATGAAALGAPVVWVRQGPACPALGLRALMAAASRAATVRGAAAFGVIADGVRVDFEKLKEHVRQVEAAVAPNEAPARLAGLGIRVIDGPLRFTSPKGLSVDERIDIMPKHVVIATGSLQQKPAIEGFDGEMLTPDTIFELRECPGSLAVLGATALGLELAQAFHRLGAAVTVIDRESPLRQEDRECSTILLERLKAQGIAFRTAQIVRAVKSANTIEIELDDNAGRLSVSHVLAAGERIPALGDLDLEAGGVVTDGGHIRIDDHQRSSNPKVFAIGDSAGSHSVQAANATASIVVRNLLRGENSVCNADAVARAIFTDPEYAQVGLVEERARALHRSIRVYRWPFHLNDGALAEREVDGHIKVVTAPDGTILGATIVGGDAAEQISAWAMAAECGLRTQDLAGWVPPYSSRAEAGKRALTAALDKGLTHPAPNRIITLLRRRG